MALDGCRVYLHVIYHRVFAVVVVVAIGELFTHFVRFLCLRHFSLSLFYLFCPFSSSSSSLLSHYSIFYFLLIPSYPRDTTRGNTDENWTQLQYRTHVMGWQFPQHSSLMLCSLQRKERKRKRRGKWLCVNIVNYIAFDLFCSTRYFIYSSGCVRSIPIHIHTHRPHIRRTFTIFVLSILWIFHVIWCKVVWRYVSFHLSRRLECQWKWQNTHAASLVTTVVFVSWISKANCAHSWARVSLRFSFIFHVSEIESQAIAMHT